ncbi:helix-turn-helix transcriptional regulator [Pseudomonas oryzihabitans]|uniref:helix-turn-helix transcriptional regulator n=1 Tax=Pseudomonas oryzihabitans TaxID=47885 RepID=UPI003CFD1D78
MSKIGVEVCQHHRGHRVIRLNTLIDKLGISRAKIYEMIDSESARHDPSFPRPIKLSTNIIGWLESQVDDWIESRIGSDFEN